jgi:hypothetical protein
MEYTFKDHLHNYAVWTAARAVQRKFTNTSNIKSAIEATRLRDFVSSNNDEMSANQFDAFHRETAKMMIDFLDDIKVRASYGQAAKIIAIYLKTSIIIKDSGAGNISKIAHPPIDNILLTRLRINFPDLVDPEIKWTQLDESRYFQLINKLRSLNFEFFWEIEKYWSPVQSE